MRRIVDLDAGDATPSDAQVGVIMALCVAVERAGGTLKFTRAEYQELRAAGYCR